MSRHYGTALEPDFEPDTLEPDPELLEAVENFYRDAFWEPTETPPEHHEEMT